MRDEVKIFVFSSCHFNEHLDDVMVGDGGFGVVININGNRVEEISGSFLKTTNARMDITGIIEGIKRIKQPSNISVFLTNKNIVDSLNEGWLQNWVLKGFKKIKHSDIWTELYTTIKEAPHSFSFIHLKGTQNNNDFQLAEKLGKMMSKKIAISQELTIKTTVIGEVSEIEQEVSVKNEKINDTIDASPILESVCVDASTIQNPGPTEYRCVDTKTREVIFKKQLGEATNNIGEFLAIVHALAHFKNEGREVKIIYSDSLNAISWVEQKVCKTKYQRNEANAIVFTMIERAINWLNNNTYETKILKWNTSAWGQIPADYGRK